MLAVTATDILDRAITCKSALGRGHPLNAKPNHRLSMDAGKSHRASAHILHIVLFALMTAVVLAPIQIASAQEQQKPAVDIAHPLQRDVIEWDEYTGRFEAVEHIQIRARVSGYLKSVHFKDGQLVKKGDLLFVIDPDPFEAAFAAAQARIVSAQAQLKLSEANLERGRSLGAQKIISDAEIDERRAARDVNAAAVKVAEADARIAQLNLGFTEVRAPVDGRVSSRLVDVGNLVEGGSSNATPLTTLVSLNPIHFVFDVSEREFLKYMRLNIDGSRPGSRTTANPVYVQLADENDWPRRGAMNFVDNVVGQATGTVRGRAIFENDGLFLQPGLFGQVRLIGSGKYEAIQIPDKAILSDQAQKIVMLVKADNKVEAQRIEIGPVIDGLRVVRKGLSQEDRVIVSGLQRVQAGAEVDPTLVTIEATPSVFDPSIDNLPAADKE